MGCGSSAHQVEVDEAEERNDVDPYKKATKSGEETFNVNLFFSMTPRRYIYIYIYIMRGKKDATTFPNKPVS